MLSSMKSLFCPADRREQSAAAATVTLAPAARKPKVQDVRAEDYPTPEKYLEGAEIPTYYQFQSN
eukprot:CAMPEP_0176224562 /NCGR_PEP_ID=MMETSP0121_2-20121125/21317_1 /TAXON_ID=160619 /ORGANISM="Kryptoperidinium foliaceum, Strain CCMP 1326" /LENGTH=64 /DNA_ID=CAMNT_0017563817 /DNA_START=78 /DNA_END=269 /DNA_ORIENTATION=-